MYAPSSRPLAPWPARVFAMDHVESSEPMTASNGTTACAVNPPEKFSMAGRYCQPGPSSPVTSTTPKTSVTSADGTVEPMSSRGRTVRTSSPKPVTMEASGQSGDSNPSTAMPSAVPSSRPTVPNPRPAINPAVRSGSVSTSSCREAIPKPRTATERATSAVPSTVTSGTPATVAEMDVRLNSAATPNNSVRRAIPSAASTVRSKTVDSSVTSWLE